MDRKHIMIITAATLLFAAALIGWKVRVNTPERKAEQFVAQHGTVFSELVDSEQTIPTTFNEITVAFWNGDHPMYEFLLGSGIGKHQYWGVYYSPDDVPLPFQNTDIPLLTSGDETWTWTSGGNNHGTTQKIAEKWYYFEAGF